MRRTTLKRERFRKQQFNFARRQGALGHFLQIQLSSWNQGASGAFYVNVGVMFDQMREHCGRSAPDIPKYDDCDFMVRLERIFPEAPDKLIDCVMQGFIQPVSAVNSLVEFQRLGWLDVVPWGFPAYCHYLLGDLERARELLQAEADYFSNRGVTYDELVKNYRFAKLEHYPALGC